MSIYAWEVADQPMLPVPEVNVQSQNEVGVVVIPNDNSYVTTTTVHPGFTSAAPMFIYINKLKEYKCQRQ
jgi:hypothetical protein